jgi:WD40 repeat protein/tRNA A-37 threonylcarbamoyl transferase component Bud32
MTSRIGQKLGNYQLIRLLGEGGFAEVYQGEHIHLGSHAAIKVLYSQLSRDDIEKFRTEARTIVRLIHPNIVRVLEFGIEDKTPYLVMDYASKGTLRQRHPKGTPLSLATVISYVKPITDALQFAHDEKLIHRDVKPENMLVGRRDEVLLSDFGIAIVAQSSRYQSTQDMAGTIAYMAPEQIQAYPRPASDQYSLGIVVYEWLSGERPFHGSFTEIAIKHSIVPPPSLREKIPAISPHVEQVVMKALAKDPKDRYPTIQAFADALEKASQERKGTFVNSPQVQPLQAPVHSDPPVRPVTPSKLQTTPQARKAPPPPIGTRLFAYSENFSFMNVVTALSWSSHGEHLAAGSADGTVGVFHTITNQSVFSSHGHSDSVKSVVWSPNGYYIVSGSDDKKIHVWNTNGRKVTTCRGHSSCVKAVAWSPDSLHIISASYDRTVRIWNATDGKPLYIYHGHTNEVNAVTWSPNRRYIASGGYDNIVQVWDTTTGKIIFSCHGDSSCVNVVAWSPDGNRIVSGNGSGVVYMWDAITGRKIFTYRGHSYEVNTLVWSPDGKYIASGSTDKTVQVWRSTNGAHIFTYRDHKDKVNAATWSPDSKQIASGSSDGTIQVWLAS